MKNPRSFSSQSRLSLVLLVCLFFLKCFVSPAQADYRSYNTHGVLDWVMVEECRPYFSAGNWSPFIDNIYPLESDEGASFSFYTGFGNGASSDSGWWHWSTWPISNPINPGDAIKVAYYGTHTSGHDGEGGNGTEGTSAGLTGGPSFGIKTNEWYRFALRCWRPADGTPHKGYIGEWIRENSTGIWYHAGTYETPFTPKGVSGLGGFMEGLPPYDGARELRFHAAYAHEYNTPATQIQKADQVTVYLNPANGDWKGGYVGLSDDSSYVFVSTLQNVTQDPLGKSYTVNCAGNRVTVTLPNQPATPAFDPIVVSSTSAIRQGSQLLVKWQMPNTSSPQLTYTIDVYDNPSYSGNPVVSFMDRSPETRQKLLDISGVATPYVRLTVADIFDNVNSPIDVAVTQATLNSATSVPNAVHGLNYAYYEAVSGVKWETMPDFASLTPELQGAVDYVDTTPRQRRKEYAFNYTGYLDVPTDGIYTFTLSSFDSSKLSIDGVEVINFNGLHQPGKKSGGLALAAGKHAIKIQYAFSEQRGQTKYKDDVSLEYQGPGISFQKIPTNAWYRVPGANEPVVALTSLTDGSTVLGDHIPLEVSITPNGATINKVQYFKEDLLVGESSTPPYSTSTFLGALSVNHFRARLFYNGNQTLDTTLPVQVAITESDIYPWTLTKVGTQHQYPTGAKKEEGVFSLVGDSVNILSRQVTGDCTIIAHLVDITQSSPFPDGTWADGRDKAGIILRSDLSPHTGLPLGQKFFSVFGQVNGTTHFQDGTMIDAGGGYSSGNVGGEWMKLQRTGNTCVTSVSDDGVNWTVVNTQTQDIGETIYVGLFQYTSGSPKYLPHVSFDNVTIIGDVSGPPDVTALPSHTTVDIGETVKFTTSVVGASPFSYQWQYNGVDLPGETGATLELTNVQLSQSGRYTVVVNNSDGTALSTVVLNVRVPRPIVGKILSENPLAYWRLNDASPSQLKDEVGSLDTTIAGVEYRRDGVKSPFHGFGNDNYAVNFRGTPDYVEIPAPFPNANTTTANFSITGWFKRSSNDPNKTSLICSYNGSDNGSGGYNGIGVYLYNDELRFSWNTTDEMGWNSGLSVADDQWTFFALTISPTKATLYTSTDGVLHSAERNGTYSPKALNKQFFMGYNYNMTPFNYYKGMLDEVALYNHTLTQADLQDILDTATTSVPAIDITSPSEEGVLAAPADITITTNVTDNNNVISKVQFYSGATLLGEDTTAPYSFSWNNVPAGNYTLTAQVVYGNNNTVRSLPVNFSVTTPPNQASNPSPADGASDVPITTQLTWTSGIQTGLVQGMHHVYFGTDPNPPFQGSQHDNTFNPGPLLFNTTYYWRVDEVNGAGTTTGSVWSFTTHAPEPGLVAHWKFDSGAGAIAYDFSPNKNDAIIHGTQWKIGHLGRALLFDGVNDYLNAENGPSLSAKTNFTLSAWIRTSSATEQVIIQQRNANGFNGEYVFKVKSNGTLNFFVYGNSSYQFDFSTTATVNDGQWHYVCAVRDGDDGYIYIDGNPTPAASANGTAKDLDSNIGVGIGRDIRDNNKPFNGFLDDVKIYNISHTGNELNTIYNNDVAQVVTGIENWRNLEFGTDVNNPTIAGNNADPDGDGINNLMEYALGLDPNVPDVNNGISTESTNLEFSMIYPRNKDATDLNYIVEGSDDLNAFSGNQPAVTETILSTVGNIEMVKATVSIIGKNRYFLRLRVSIQ